MVQDEIEYKIDEIKMLLAGRSPIQIKKLAANAPPNSAEYKGKTHHKLNSDLFE